MASSSRPPMKGQRSVSPSDGDLASSSTVSDTPSQLKAVRDFEAGLDMSDYSRCIATLKNDFEALSLSGSPFEWLKEPLAMGFTPEEVVDLLLEERKHSPWIPFGKISRSVPRGEPSHPTPRELPPFDSLNIGPPLREMDPDSHQANCIHQSLYHESRSMKSLTTEAKRKISEFCGLGGIKPSDPAGQVRFEDSTAYICYRESEQDGLSEPQIAERALIQCEEALDSIARLCGYLQENGWVCNHLVVIRDDHGFRSAVIPFYLIAQLRECVVEAMSRHLLHPDPRNCRMFDTALELLWMEAPASISTGYRPENAVDLCALAVQMINISLLSICKAHVGALHPWFLDRPITKICLSGIDGPMSKEHKVGFHLGGLGCLGLMLGSPIMVFASGWPPLVHEDSRDILTTSVEHLLELWGPGRIVPRSSASASVVQAIEIGGGVIYKPTGTSATSGNLHWAPGVFRDAISEELFDITAPLNIAGLFTINQGCPARLQQDDIPIDPSLCISQEIYTLGTQQAFWGLQQIQAGLQVGQIANGTLNGTWMKSASRTRKEQALTRAGVGVTHLSSEFFGVDVLDQPLGLLVSLCTGIARRVPLREVVAEVSFPWGRATTLSTYEICGRLRRSGFDKWLSSLSYDDEEDIRSGIRAILRILRWTGISFKSNLVTACTSEFLSDGCFHIRLKKFPVLATILKDTVRTATFASLTTECVITDKCRCQCVSNPRWGNRVTALATSVCQYRYVGDNTWERAPNKGLEHGNLYWMGDMDENRKLVAEVSSGQGDEVVLKVAESQGHWSFFLRAYERVERMRSRYIALREQDFVGEKGAQEVFIVSG